MKYTITFRRVNGTSFEFTNDFLDSDDVFSWADRIVNVNDEISHWMSIRRVREA